MMSGAGTPKQDVFTREELTLVVYKLNRGKYVLNVSDNGDTKISRLKEQWIDKDDVGLEKPFEDK